MQDKKNRGKGGGWRWHKWGEYIGKLNPQCEYLDDEDFGPEFSGYVICFHIYPVPNRISKSQNMFKERIARKALERIRRDADRKVDKIYELLEPNYDYSFSYVELVQAAYIGTRKRIHKVFETLGLEFEDFETACERERIRFRKILDSKPYGSVADYWGYYPESKWESVYNFLRSTYAY